MDSIQFTVSGSEEQIVQFVYVLSGRQAGWEEGICSGIEIVFKIEHIENLY